jgi:hypothetical protein
MACALHYTFTTNRQLVFSSFFPFLKRLPLKGQPFSVLTDVIRIDAEILIFCARKDKIDRENKFHGRSCRK